MEFSVIQRMLLVDSHIHKRLKHVMLFMLKCEKYTHIIVESNYMLLIDTVTNIYGQLI